MWSYLVRLIKQQYYQAYFHAIINSTLLDNIGGSAILHPALLAQYNLCQSSKVYSNAGGLYLMHWHIISSNAAIQKQVKQKQKKNPSCFKRCKCIKLLHAKNTMRSGAACIRCTPFFIISQNN